MARIARAVAPGIPHHVTQRGNRRQQTFFNDEDYQFYLEVMSQWWCPFGKAAQIRKISVNVHKKEDNRPIRQNVLRFVSDKNESGTII